MFYGSFARSGAGFLFGTSMVVKKLTTVLEKNALNRSVNAVIT